MRRRTIVAALFTACLGMFGPTATRRTVVAYGVISTLGRPAQGGTVTFFEMRGEQRPKVASIGVDGRYWLLMSEGRYRVRIESTSLPRPDTTHQTMAQGLLCVMNFDCGVTR